jgi:hypothetical protein
MPEHIVLSDVIVLVEGYIERDLHLRIFLRTRAATCLPCSFVLMICRIKEEKLQHQVEKQRIRYGTEALRRNARMPDSGYKFVCAPCRPQHQQDKATPKASSLLDSIIVRVFCRQATLELDLKMSWQKNVRFTAGSFQSRGNGEGS